MTPNPGSWILSEDLLYAFAMPLVVFGLILTVRNVNKDYERNEKGLKFLHNSVAKWFV